MVANRKGVRNIGKYLIFATYLLTTGFTKFMFVCEKMFYMENSFNTNFKSFTFWGKSNRVLDSRTLRLPARILSYTREREKRNLETAIEGLGIMELVELGINLGIIFTCLYICI